MGSARGYGAALDFCILVQVGDPAKALAPLVESGRVYSSQSLYGSVEVFT